MPPDARLHRPKICLIVLLTTTSNSAIGQTEPQSPRDLIRYLTYQADRPDIHGIFSVAFSCGTTLGEAQDQRALTRSLVALGSPAVPAIEEALDSFEAYGYKSKVQPGMAWLLYTYARIKGPAAYPRLHRLIGNPMLGSWAVGIDNSIALEFGLTSYVSSFRETGHPAQHECAAPGSDTGSLGPKPCKPPLHEIPVESFRCDRGAEPRDVLDKLILPWETNDRLSLEATLGPTAASALTELLKGRTWATMRSASWPRMAQKNVEVGYRFHVSGRWSEPEETLEEHRPAGNLEEDYDHPEIETSFTNRSGHACGDLRLKFFSTPETRIRLGSIRYLIDNADLANLLQLIGSCAADTPLAF
jgi:hypothetical protein